MRTKMLLCLGLVGACLATCGCELEKPETVGFLSDYSHLRPETDTRSRYFPPGDRLANYSRFIVEPVALYLDDKTKAELGDDAELEGLARYMHETLVKTLEPRYPVTRVTPGPGTARLRVALTHLKKDRFLTPGIVAIEAELLDSQTGEQLMAIREIQRPRTRSGGLSEWDDAKRVMDDWARRFYAELEEHRTR
ncbi:MAG: hypothetical protein A2Y76_09470 [Planctomycetes bacterium RBG_13_60_9]|nr:MAG: hypothetical protein A2Y76_09470 [Planctomycetes bacterium RBG_13_60_9]